MFVIMTALRFIKIYEKGGKKINHSDADERNASRQMTPKEPKARTKIFINEIKKSFLIST